MVSPQVYDAEYQARALAMAFWHAAAADARVSAQSRATAAQNAAALERLPAR